MRRQGKMTRLITRTGTQLSGALVFALLIATLWGFAAQAAETTTYVLTDVQGTVLAREDSHGTTTATYDYRPYGKQQTGPTATGPAYTGHVADPDTGLVYMQARYYDPEMGRFLTVDLIEMGARDGYEFNRYAYVTNNPIIIVDPTGAFPQHMSADQMDCEIYHCERSGSGETTREQLAAKAIRLADNALTSARVLGHYFGSADSLAIAWSDAVVPITIKLNVEIGSSIMYLKNSGFTCTSTYSSGDRNTIDNDAIPFYPNSVAEMHTHPGNRGFSGTTAYAFPNDPYAHVSGTNGDGDVVRYFNNSINGYVALRNGAVYGWRVQPFRENVDYYGGYHYLSEAVYTVRGPK